MENERKNEKEKENANDMKPKIKPANPKNKWLNRENGEMEDNSITYFPMKPRVFKGVR